MKKLKLTELYVVQTSNAKPGAATPAAKPGAISADDAMKQIKSTNLTQFSALNQTPPEEDPGVGPDARQAGLIGATISNPQLLLLWIKDNPLLAAGTAVAVGGGIATVPALAKGAFNLSKLLLKVGGKAIRRLVVGRNAKEAAEYLAKIMKTEIFNEYDGWLRKWKNTKLLNKDMRFLCLGLKQRGLITSSEAAEFLKVIASGRLDKSMFKSTSEARKAFKDFAMAFAHKGLISVRTLKSLAELSPADIKALENARIQTKKAMGMATTSADPTKPKTFRKYKPLSTLKTRVRF